MTDIRPRQGIMSIAPYQGGKSSLSGQSDVVKLSSNENPYGPSDAAKEAYLRGVHELHRYPPTDHIGLRAAIGEVHGVDPARVICGVGSDEIIAFLCNAYAGPGDEVIYTEHGFAMYRISALAAGATPVMVKETKRTVDVKKILKACNENTKLVFIANPNNPTGTMIEEKAVRQLADGLPPHTLLVLDGAYAEYVNGFDGGARVVDERENVVMTRTFSKLYGLGGLRVGWGYGPAHVIDVLNRIRGPFNLSAVQLETAEAALRDVAYAKECREKNARMREWMQNALNDLGVECDASEANFVLARFRNQKTAQDCDAHLQANGLIVRQVAGYNLPNCLRITVGDEPSCRRVVYAISEFLGATT